MDNSGLIVSALYYTDPELYAAIDAANSWKNAIIKRGARVALYRNYERGDHRADITKEMRKMLRLSTDDADMTDFNDNYCRVVVDKMAGRLFVSNIAVDDNAKDWLEETLTRNDFDAQQLEWYRGAIRDGDSYVMVDPVTAYWTSESAYDGFGGIEVIFDDMTRKPIWACKLWSEADTQDISGDDVSNAIVKLVVYQPGQISYWLGDESGQEVRPDNIVPVKPILDRGRGMAAVVSPDPEMTNFQPWPLPSQSLPIVHIANQKDNYTSYGESELRPAVPLQDVLNRTLHSMVMASELSAFKIYWSIGMNIDKDGIIPGAIINMVPFDPTQGVSAEQVEYLKAIRVGEFGETDISQYTNQIDKIVQQISQSTQTPIYGVTAEGNLSGEALKQLEVGLLGKIERFQHQNSDAIKELITLTAEIQNTFEGENAPPFDAVNVIWKSPELLDVNARIATLVQLREKAPGLLTDEFFIKRIGVLLGMSQNDIQEEVDKAGMQQGFSFDLFTAANNETAA